MEFTIPAVKIACKGEVLEAGIEKFTAAQLDEDSHIEEGYLSPISQAVGQPMRIFRRRDLHVGRDRRYLQNSPATFMMVDADPASGTFGWAPMDWQDNNGSVLVARNDMKPLEPRDVAAMAHFCQHTMSDPFQDCLFEGTITKGQLAAKMTPAAYNTYKAAYAYRPDHPEYFE